MTMANAWNVRTVAQYLSVNERTIYRMAERGELPAFKVGGSWRFRPEEIDAWIKRHRGVDYDNGGAWAASGKVHANLLNALLDEPYFHMPAPKSTGREFMNLAWLDRKLAAAGDVSPVDVQATLLELTVQTIRSEIGKLLQSGEVIVCGGGARNTALMKRLQETLPNFTLHTSTDYGIHADCVEAVAFAWMAKKTLQRETVDFGPFTGARHPVIAGGIYHCE